MNIYYVLVPIVLCITLYFWFNLYSKSTENKRKFVGITARTLSQVDSINIGKILVEDECGEEVLLPCKSSRDLIVEDSIVLITDVNKNDIFIVDLYPNFIKKDVNELISEGS